MNSSHEKYSSVDAYIAKAPAKTQKILRNIRQTIRANAPEAVEGIAYGMPAYKLNGKPLAYFAVFKHHIGFYAIPLAHTAFAKQLSKYKSGKGSVQFPLDLPIPISLISKMVKFNKLNIIKK